MEMAVAADSSIFVMGGFANSNPTAKVDAYDTESNTWSSIAPMNTSRAFAAAVRGSDGYIYAIGGFSPTECDQCHVASVERYVAVRPGLTPTPLRTPFPQVDPTPPCVVCSGAATPTPTHAAQPTPTHVVQPTPTPTPSCRVVFSGSINTITSTTSYIDLATGQTSGSQTGGDDLQWSTFGPAPAFDALNGTHLGDLSNYSAASCATLEGLTYPKSAEPASNGETFAAKLADGDLAKVQVSLPGTEPYPILQVVTYAP